MIFANDGNNDFQGIVCKKICLPKKTKMTGYDSADGDYVSHRPPGPTSQELEASAISAMPKNEAKKHICSAAPGLALFVGLVGPSTGGSGRQFISFKDFSRLKNVSLLRDIGHFEQNCSPVKTVENNKTLNLLK